MNRFKTKFYVTTDYTEALVLAKRGGTNQDKIKTTYNVEVLHCQPNAYWAFWSDDKLTTSNGLSGDLLKASSLSKDAVQLISNVYGSDGGSPKEVGGYTKLAKIEKFYPRLN